VRFFVPLVFGLVSLVLVPRALAAPRRGDSPSVPTFPAASSSASSSAATASSSSAGTDIPVLGGTTPARCPDGSGWVQTKATPACVRVGLRQPPGDVSTLFVFIHGDGNPVPLDNPLLRRLRRLEPTAATAALVRPGYTDREGGMTTPVVEPVGADAYRREDALLLGETVDVLRARTRATRVVVVGHSGGAALAANIAALFPGLVAHVVIASCPCDLAGWRAHRRWFGPYRSLSPHLVADDIPPTTTVSLVVGEDDDNTPVFLHTGYADIVRSAGGQARTFVVNGVGHEVLRVPAVVEFVAGLVRVGAPHRPTPDAPSAAGAAPATAVAVPAGIREVLPGSGPAPDPGGAPITDATPRR
jgi:predicted esterase